MNFMHFTGIDSVVTILIAVQVLRGLVYVHSRNTWHGFVFSYMMNRLLGSGSVLGGM